MDIQEIKKKKKELALSAKDLADLSGLPLSTVQKVLGGFTKSPRRTTLLALEAALIAASKKQHVYNTNIGDDSYLREPLPAYDLINDHSAWTRQGSYTINDYLALPEDRKVELIDGVFYDMPSPTTVHQIIATKILNKLSNFIDSNHGKCVPFVAPADIQLDCDDKTIVQPDVFVVCDKSKIRMSRVFGSPDFVVEILSPATRSKDINIKSYKYRLAGVREYWIVDSDKRKVIVYAYGKEPDVFVYGFSEKVPVGIYDGKCLIDFSEIFEAIRFLYE